MQSTVESPKATGSLDLQHVGRLLEVAGLRINHQIVNVPRLCNQTTI